MATGEGCARTFVCPYHGWTYRLDGGLQRVPHDYGFPGLDTRTHGLAPRSWRGSGKPSAGCKAGSPTSTARRDAAFVSDAGVGEDRALVESVQRSIGSGANGFFTFGHVESAIVHFHRNPDAALEVLTPTS